MATLERAITIAMEAHASQKDKYGEPYIGHLFRVMNGGRTAEEKITGVLHDLVEDTAWTFDALQHEGFSSAIIDALKCLTKINEEEDYDLFIQRVLANPLATRVKLNDLADNMDIKRLPEISEKDRVRLNKYLKAYRTILSVL